MNHYTKLAKNSLLFAVGSFGSRAVSILMLPLYTRFLSPADYGKIDVFMTTLFLLTPLVSAQATESVFRFSMDKSKPLSTTLMNGLFLCFAGTALALAFAPFLASWEFFAKHAFLFYLVLFLAMIDSVSKQFTRGIGRIKCFITSDILYAVVFAGSNMILIALLGWGVQGYLFSLVSASLLSIVFLLLFGGVGSYFSLRSVDRSMLWSMIIYSAPLIPTAIMWWLMNLSDRYLLTYFLGFEATGVYAVACKIPVILLTANTIFFTAWQISAIEEYNSPDFPVMFANVFEVLSVFLFVCMSLILMVLKPLLAVLVSAGFYEAWQYVPLLLLGVIFSSLSAFGGVIYVASKRTVGALVTTGLGALINLGLNIVLIPVIGIQAAAISTVIGYMVTFFMRWLHIKEIAKMTLELGNVIQNSIFIGIQIFIIFNIDNYIISFILQTIILILIIISNYKTFYKLTRLVRAKISNPCLSN